MDNNLEVQKIIDQIESDVYKFYASIAKNTHPDFKSGAIIIPTYFKNRKDSGLGPYVGKVMQPAKDVILDFGNGIPELWFVYDNGIFMDTAQMMINLI